MGRTVNILLLFSLTAIAVNLWAQQAKGKDDRKKALKNVVVPATYLGHSDRCGGAIKKDELDALLKQGLTSKDSLGGKYRVVGFQFSYGERRVYEDSAGNLQMVYDFSFEYCPGDTLASDVAASIYGRTKPGDSVFFDRISVARYYDNSGRSLPDSNAVAARGMKFYIVK